MRVVVVDLLCNSPPYCGAMVASLCREGVAAELASPDSYLEPGFLSPYERSPWLVDAVVDPEWPKVARQAVRGLELLRNFLRLRRSIGRGEYDVVHVQWIPRLERQCIFMSLLRSVCDRRGTPLVYTAHNVLPHDTPSANRALIRRNIELADAVVAHTQDVARGLREELGLETEIAVIPHGPLFADRVLASPDEAAGRLGLSAGPMVLFQGGIMPYKGIDILAEAWPAVLREHPTAALAIVGRSGSDSVRDELAVLEQMDGVRVVDEWIPTAQMLDYYAASSVVVLPYKAISQSGALMTAVGLGRPTVITPLAGFLEQVSGLASVVVAREVSGTAVADAVCVALSDRRRLAEEALLDRRRIMESPAGWPSIARKTLDLYMGAGVRR